jgi:hypothetical protein
MSEIVKLNESDIRNAGSWAMTFRALITNEAVKGDFRGRGDALYLQVEPTRVAPIDAKACEF